jgi:hypothetical protein
MAPEITRVFSQNGKLTSSVCHFCVPDLSQRPTGRFEADMPEPIRQKITFGEMRGAGVRGLLVYCSDFRCSHWTAISGDRWPDGVRLSDIEP